MIRIIAGLGNPGDKYAGTRHNIGFDVLDILADRLNAEFMEKFDGLLSEIRYNGEKLYLLKPQTFMNLSGKSVAGLANFYKIDVSEILIIHDEMNIPYNTIKLRHKGSAGGHNGLKSIIECMGSDNFPRLKMGIGRDASKDVVSYVLGKYKPDELKLYDDFINKGADACIEALNNGLNKAMSIYNQWKNLGSIFLYLLPSK